jgi:hypothetical protein
VGRKSYAAVDVGELDDVLRVVEVLDFVVWETVEELDDGLTVLRVVDRVDVVSEDDVARVPDDELVDELGGAIELGEDAGIQADLSVFTSSVTWLVLPPVEKSMVWTPASPGKI